MNSGKELSKTKALKLKITIKTLVIRTTTRILTAKTAFMLATVINTEIAKTETSFLTFRTMDIEKYNAFSDYSFSNSPALSFFLANLYCNYYCYS